MVMAQKQRFAIWSNTSVDKLTFYEYEYEYERVSGLTCITCDASVTLLYMLRSMVIVI